MRTHKYTVGSVHTQTFQNIKHCREKYTQNGKQGLWNGKDDLPRAGFVHVCRTQRRTIWQCTAAAVRRRSGRHSARRCCCCWKFFSLHHQWWCPRQPDQLPNQRNDRPWGKIKNTHTVTHIITYTSQHTVIPPKIRQLEFSADNF